MISVIIVNYNGRHLLQECLDAVRMMTPAGTEIIVHDNGSSDGSLEFLAASYPEVRLSRADSNLGFVGGNNVASKLASGDYLLLLNSDTIMRASVQPMIDILERDSTIWVVGSRLIYGDGTQQESIGKQLGPLRLSLSWTPLAQLFGLFRRTVRGTSPLYSAEIVDCDWVSGACLLTSRKHWGSLGGLDPQYFMYMEDVDYCVRVRRAGGRVVYTSATVVTHLEGAGRPWIGQRAVLNTATSYVIFARKFYGVSGRILLGIVLPMVWGIRAMGHGLAYLVGRDAYGKEKALAYYRGASIVMTSSSDVASY